MKNLIYSIAVPAILLAVFHPGLTSADEAIPQIDAEITPIYTSAETQPELVEAFVYDMALPLDPDLQAHTWELSQRYSVPYEVLLAIMHHESRYIPDVPDNINADGSRDRGLMQINSVNWAWLEGEGLDVSDPYDNIEAGAMILSQYLNKYDLKTALACYAAGESGMQQGRGFWFAEEILEMIGDV